MARKKRPEIYVSPDGGETVYVQKADGSRGRLVSQTQYAKDIETIQDEQEMVDEYAVTAIAFATPVRFAAALKASAAIAKDILATMIISPPSMK